MDANRIAQSSRSRSPAARFFAWWEVEHCEGAVVAVDVLRAFTTAAYAFANGRGLGRLAMQFAIQACWEANCYEIMLATRLSNSGAQVSAVL